MRVSEDIEIFNADCSKFDDLYKEITILRKYSIALSKEPGQKFVSIHLWDMQSGDWGDGVELSNFRQALDVAEHILMTRSEYQEPEIEA